VGFPDGSYDIRPHVCVEFAIKPLFLGFQFDHRGKTANAVDGIGRIGWSVHVLDLLADRRECIGLVDR